MFSIRSTPKTPTAAPKAEISAPKDGRKLAPGPNQVAGALEHAPGKLKNQLLDLQNRPAAFFEGSQATRKLAGRDVAISSPLLSMKFPAGKGAASPKTGPSPTSAKAGGPPAQDLSNFDGSSQALVRRDPRQGSGTIAGNPGDSQALVKRDSRDAGTQTPKQDLSLTAGGHDPDLPTPKPNRETPFRLTAPPEHVPTPPASDVSANAASVASKPATQDAAVQTPPSRPQTPSRPPQDTRPHSDPGLEMLHFSQPGGHADGPPPPPYTPRPTQHQTAQQPNGEHEGHGPADPDGPEEEKKGMSLGKKVLIGAAAVLGITLLTSGGSSTPPPSGGIA